MASLNQVTFLGNATKDPEVNTTKNGTTYCKFGLAVNDRVKRGEEWVDEAMFIDVTVWGKSADYIGGHLTKGGQVLVTGKLKLNTWEKDGVKHSRHQVEAAFFDGVKILGNRPRHDDQEPVESGAAKQSEGQIPW